MTTYAINTTRGRGNRHARRARKHSWGRRIVRSFKDDGRIWELHATMGWRSYRAWGQE